MQKRVVVIGAGIGGLAAAAELARVGHEVLVLERAKGPGGKMRVVQPAGRPIDAGPTVLTMRWVFDELFRRAGLDFGEAVPLTAAEVLARHQWPETMGGGRLDLYVDRERSAEAIGAFAGQKAVKGFQRFCDYAARIYAEVEAPFIEAQRPTITGVLTRNGVKGLAGLTRIDSMRSMWKALGTFFDDPRLRQLFARYATYAGSSPFEAPGTLNLIAHVEMEGVWVVTGGMHRLAQAMAELVIRQGGALRYGAEVAAIEVEGGRVSGVRLASGESISADLVVSNADAGALAQGLLGAPAHKAIKPPDRALRSQSAVTWCFEARAEGFPLVRHNVFFGADYPEEFDAVFKRRALPADPTVYVCAQDRDGPIHSTAAERLFVLINAPAVGDDGRPDEEEIRRCEVSTFQRLKQAGLTLTDQSPVMRTTPTQFEAMFPGTGGALYGMASHTWRASFLRPAAWTKLPGLYLVGGYAHPGAGVPMVARSGLLAAERIQQDLGAPPLTSR